MFQRYIIICRKKNVSRPLPFLFIILGVQQFSRKAHKHFKILLIISYWFGNTNEYKLIRGLVAKFFSYDGLLLYIYVVYIKKNIGKILAILIKGELLQFQLWFLFMCHYTEMEHSELGCLFLHHWQQFSKRLSVLECRLQFYSIFFKFKTFARLTFSDINIRRFATINNLKT